MYPGTFSELGLSCSLGSVQGNGCSGQVVGKGDMVGDTHLLFILCQGAGTGEKSSLASHP